MYAEEMSALNEHTVALNVRTDRKATAIVGVAFTPVVVIVVHHGPGGNPTDGTLSQ
jgi:hypothetical protein